MTPKQIRTAIKALEALLQKKEEGRRKSKADEYREKFRKKYNPAASK